MLGRTTSRSCCCCCCTCCFRQGFKGHTTHGEAMVESDQALSFICKSVPIHGQNANFVKLNGGTLKVQELLSNPHVPCQTSRWIARCSEQTDHALCHDDSDELVVRPGAKSVFFSSAASSGLGWSSTMGAPKSMKYALYGRRKKMDLKIL